MQVCLWRFRTMAIVAGGIAIPAMSAVAQQAAQQTVGSIQSPAAAQNIQVSGNLSLQGSTLLLGNGSTVTAGPQTLDIRLTRGGDLDICATTQVHLSQTQSSTDSSGPLMMALGHGALEARYTLGKDSDVLLTPDLRILLSGPGQADVRVRVNSQGDTCVDNRADRHGAEAPYVTVSEEMGDGVYRVHSNQRVLFEHGSLRSVVDNEPEPCGCPATPVLSIASANAPSTGKIAKPGTTTANAAATTNADTAFPIAESEGLAPLPGLPTKPVVAPGQVHVEVATTLTYDANHPPPANATASEAAASPGHASGGAAGSAAATTQAPQPKPSSGGIFRHIGHFFKQIFRKA